MLDPFSKNISFKYSLPNRAMVKASHESFDRSNPNVFECSEFTFVADVGHINAPEDFSHKHNNGRFVAQAPNNRKGLINSFTIH